MVIVNLQSEYVLSIFGFSVTNTFITSLVVTSILIGVALIIRIRGHRVQERSLLYKYTYIGVYELLRLTDSITSDRNLSRRILPLVGTLFVFIGFSNLLALVPGFLGSFFITTQQGDVPLLRSPNSDLTTTLALALVTVAAIQYFAIKKLGVRGYVKKFLNFSGPSKFIVGIFEILSEFVKILSYSFRLFGNIFAGEVLLLVIAFLFPLILPLPFMALEVFVSIIQAFIFSMLTLTYIKTSVTRHV